MWHATINLSPTMSLFALDLATPRFADLHKTNQSSQDKQEALGQCISPPWHVLPVSWYWSRSAIQIATKIYTFVQWPIADLPGKFHANPVRRICAKLLAERWTNNDDYHISSNRSPGPLLAQLCQSSGLHLRPGLYSRPGLYYHIHIMTNWW